VNKFNLITDREAIFKSGIFYLNEKTPCDFVVGVTEYDLVIAAIAFNVDIGTNYIVNADKGIEQVHFNIYAVECELPHNPLFANICIPLLKDWLVKEIIIAAVNNAKPKQDNISRSFNYGIYKDDKMVLEQVFELVNKEHITEVLTALSYEHR